MDRDPEEAIRTQLLNNSKSPPPKRPMHHNSEQVVPLTIRPASSAEAPGQGREVPTTTRKCALIGVTSFLGVIWKVFQSIYSRQSGFQCHLHNV